MKIKLLLIIFMLFFSLIFQVIGNPLDNEKENIQSLERFFNCYVEINTKGEYDSKGTHPEFGLSLMMLYDEKTETTIYSEKNGDILWQFQGVHWIKITLFIGYEEINENSIKLYGRALNLRVYTI
jgi:hypothetical protein